MDKNTVNILSLCTGGGGLELGLKLACESFRVVCCVENEAFCCEILATRMEEKALDDAPIWTDLRTFNGKPWRGVVDCIIGGYPCQPFSVAGKRAGEDDDRHLWPEIARIISEVEPSMCFFENVAGHLNLGFDTVLADLREMGYRVAAGLFTASEVGASHRRERLFILANAANGGCQTEAATAKEENGPSDEKRDTRQLSRRFGGPCGNMADTDGNGKQRCPTGQGQVQSRRSGAQLADAARGGVEGIGASRQQEPQAQAGQEVSRCDGIPVFPPGPSDLESWRRILEADPTLEPAICRVADGTSCRVERLRLLGNTVVPLQAAYAFVTLWSCLFAERGEHGN